MGRLNMNIAILISVSLNITLVTIVLHPSDHHPQHQVSTLHKLVKTGANDIAIAVPFSRRPYDVNRIKEISVIDRYGGLKYLTKETTVFDECEVKCKLNMIHDFTDASDAIVIYGTGFTLRIPPRRQNPDQVWIFASWDAPPHSTSKTFSKPQWHKQINWTITYRLDSTIPSPYGVVKKVKGIRRDYSKIISQKTKLVAWVANECVTVSNREKYVKLLKETVKVDIFGDCGNKASNKIFQEINNNYKFYLAFEHSLCNDYVTGELFDIWNLNVVPIVRGGGNFSHFYPKGSYINTGDFKTPEALGRLLLYLDENTTAYTKYLKAKEHYVTEATNRRDALCKLCSMLNSVEKYHHVYENVHEWYTNGQCRPPSDLRKIKL